ncbi:MAG: VTT domain-containing protein [Bacteroidia bacterium]|nr:VTT domain-containing protein [Bacteroidia bacterium]
MTGAEFIEFIQRLFHPETIIHLGGLTLLSLVVFAETGLMIGFFLPGDSLLFTAGLLCATGFFDTSIYNLLIFVTLAAVFGDSVGYYFGKKMGEKLFTKKESWLFKPEYVTITKRFYEKYGGKALVLGRFLPIVRTFAPVLAGVVKLQYRRFVVFNVSGAVLWVFSLTLTGYFLGVLVPEIRQYLEHIIISLIIITAIPVIRTYLKERKEQKNQHKTPDSSQ